MAEVPRSLKRNHLGSRPGSRVPALWLGSFSEGLGSHHLLKEGWVIPVVFQTSVPESCVQIKSYKKMQINLTDDSKVGLRSHLSRPPSKSPSFENCRLVQLLTSPSQRVGCA